MTHGLDELLSSWAESRQPGDNHLHLLADKIRLAAVQERASRANAKGVHAAIVRLAYTMLGAAAVLAVVAIGRLSLRNETPRDSGGLPAPLASLADLSPGEIETGRRVFSEFERLFSDKLRWIAQSNGEVSLGVEALRGGPAGKSAGALLRLAMVARRDGERSWRPVWTTDILLHGEEMVEVVPDQGEGNRLALWIYPLADGRVAVDADLALDKPVRMSSRSNAVVTQKTASQIMSVRRGDTEYRIIQNVAVLNG